MKELILTTEAITGNPLEITKSKLYGWHGVEYKFPRNLIFKRNNGYNELLKGLTCVYILIGENDDFPCYYIGEAEDFFERIKQHKDKDWWKEVLIFAGDESFKLEKSQIKYIENNLYVKAKKNEKYKRFKVSNENKPTKSSLNHTTNVMTDDYIDYLIKVTLLQNYSLFREQEKIEFNEDDLNILCIKKNDKIIAYGKQIASGFLVKAGATMLDMTEKTSQCFKLFRQKLINDGVINNNKLVIDYEFNSPSAASVQVLGHNSNGLIDWKNINGVSLKNLEM